MHRKLEKIEQNKEYAQTINDVGEQVYNEQYVETSEQALWWARETQSVLEDLSYGCTENEKLDLFVPHRESINSGTLYIYVHGGYWEKFDKSGSAFAATNFQQHGDYFAVLNYALADNMDVLALVEQNRRAIVYLFQNAELFGFDPQRIVLIGSSAGAHLAAMMCATMWSRWRRDNDVATALPKDLIKGVVAINGVYDLAQLQNCTEVDPPTKCPNQINAISPVKLKIKNTSQFVLVVSEIEPESIKQQSLAFCQIIEKQKMECKVVEIKGKNQFDIIFDLAKEDSDLYKLCRNLLN